MNDLSYTLLSDGSSDIALLPILTWLLRQHFTEFAIQARWADLRPIKKRPQGLIERIELSLELFPCKLLFVHRDAENQEPDLRRKEIIQAIAMITNNTQRPPAICVVPVRMQEAWLLFDEKALRIAAGNPNGRQALDLPEIRRLESIPDPKVVLRNLLNQASNLRGRRLKKFQANIRPVRVAELIDDFSLLRGLSAFATLEGDIQRLDPNRF